MRKLLTIIISFIFILIAAEKEGKVTYIESIADEVEFSFANSELITKGGKTKVDDITIQANSIKKIEDKNIILAYGEIIFEQGKDNKVEADELEVDIDTKIAKIKNGRSYAKINDSKTIHNKLYYGGKEFEARFPNKAIVKDAYFTTCDYVLSGKTPHYQLKAKKIKVYLEKRVVAYNTLLYIGKVPVMWFPFYVTSLKSGDDEAPLFPRFGNDVKFGQYVVWGFDYGENDSKVLNGSLALKLSENKGLSIDSWVNKYTIKEKKNYGELKLVDTIINESVQSEKQHDFTHIHNYKNDKGTLYWEYNNKSINAMNGWTEEQIEDFRLANKDSRANLDEVVVYKLKTEFDKLGKKKENYIFADIAWTENKDFAAADAVKDDDEGEVEDVIESVNDVKRNMEFKLKRTAASGAYMVYGRYKLYEDLNPGTSSDDLFGKDEEQEYDLDLKTLKIYPYYKMTEKDTRATYSDTNRNNNFVTEYTKDGNTINQFDLYEDLETLPKYDIKQTEKKELKIGDYSIGKKELKLKWGALFTETSSEDKLNLDMYYDKGSDKDNNTATDIDGDEEYMYFNEEDIVYKKSENTMYKLDLKQDTRTLSLGIGETVLETRERDGEIKIDENQNDISEYEVVEEDSENKTVSVSDTNINLGLLGKMDAKYTFKRDWYVQEDIYTSQDYAIGHEKELYNNVEDAEAYFSLKLKNEADYSYKWFTYDIGDRLKYESEQDGYIEDLEQTEDELIKEYWENRLGSKVVNRTYSDTISAELGNLKTAYTYKRINDFNGFYVDYSDDYLLERDYVENKIDFSIDKTTSLGLTFSNDEKFDDRMPDDDEFKNYDKDAIGLTLKDNGRTFTFSNSDSTSRTKGERDVAGVMEDYLTLDTTDTDKYSYSVGRWKFLYNIQDKYKRKVIEASTEEVDSESITTDYSVTYSFGTKLKRNLTVQYNDYENKMNPELSKNKFKMQFVLTDNREVEEPEKEEGKLVIEEILGMTEAELQQEVDTIEDIDRKPTLGVDLSSLGEDKEEEKIDNQKEYKFNLELDNNKEYFKENGKGMSAYSRSVLNFVTGVEVDYGDYEFTYKYSQSRSVAGEETTKKLHFSSVKTYLGEPGSRWGFGYEIEFDDAIIDSDENKKLQEYKLLIEKEFHCNAVGLAYETEWDSERDEYSNTWSINFFILAFPSKRLNVERVKDKDEHKIVGSIGI